MTRFLGLFVLLLCAVPAAAQPVATSDQSIAFDFPDSDVAAGGPVTRFEMQIDGGAWSNVGMNLVPGSPESYYAALMTGTHTAQYRACNDVDLCGGPLVFMFRLGFVPATIQGPARIIDTPPPANP